MNRLAYHFDRHIAQAIFGHYCASTALFGLFSNKTMIAYVRADYGAWAYALIFLLLFAGAWLELDALARIAPLRYLRELSNTRPFVLFARYRHWLYLVGIFWSVVLISVSGAHDPVGAPAFAFLYGFLAFYGLLLMVRDGCVDNFNALKQKAGGQ